MKKIFKTTVKNFAEKVVSLNEEGKFETFNQCPFTKNDWEDGYKEDVTVCLCKDGEKYSIMYFNGYVSLGEIKRECSGYGYTLVNYCQCLVDEYMWAIDYLIDGKVGMYHFHNCLNRPFGDELRMKMQKVFNIA